MDHGQDWIAASRRAMTKAWYMLRFHQNCKVSQKIWKLHITSGFHVWTSIKANQNIPEVARDHYFEVCFTNWSISGTLVHVCFVYIYNSSSGLHGKGTYLLWFHVHQYLKCLRFTATLAAVVQFLSKFGRTPPFGFTASSSTKLAAPLATPVEDTTSLPLQGFHHHSASATQTDTSLHQRHRKLPSIGWIWILWSKTTSQNLKRIATIRYPFFLEAPHLPRNWSQSSLETHCVIEIPFAMGDPVGVGIVMKWQRDIFIGGIQ